MDALKATAKKMFGLLVQIEVNFIVCEVKTSLQSKRLSAAGSLHLSSGVSASLNRKNFLLCVLICTFFSLWGRFFSLPAPTCCPPPPLMELQHISALYSFNHSWSNRPLYNSWKRAVFVWAWAERQAAAGLRSQVFSPGQSSVCYWAVRTQEKHVKTSEQNQSALPQQAEVNGWRSACCLSAHSAATRWASSSSDVSLCSWINCRDSRGNLDLNQNLRVCSLLQPLISQLLIKSTNSIDYQLIGLNNNNRRSIHEEIMVSCLSVHCCIAFQQNVQWEISVCLHRPTVSSIPLTGEIHVSKRWLLCWWLRRWSLHPLRQFWLLIGWQLVVLAWWLKFDCSVVNVEKILSEAPYWSRRFALLETLPHLTNHITQSCWCQTAQHVFWPATPICPWEAFVPQSSQTWRLNNKCDCGEMLWRVQPEGTWWSVCAVATATCLNL